MGKHRLLVVIVVATVILLMLFGALVATIGYNKFNETLTERYNDSAYHTAISVTQFVSGDDADDYLRGERLDEQKKATALLADFCENQGVAIIYIIAPEKDKDYKYYYSVINCPSAATGYTPWLLGTEIEQKTPEYWQIYADLMEGRSERETVKRTTNLNGAVPHITSLIPLKRADGSVAGIICVQQLMSALNEWSGSYLLIVGLTTLVLAALAAAGYVLVAKKQFVSPIRTIMLEAERFAEQNSAPNAPLNAEISTIREISALSEAVDKMERSTLAYIENLSSVISERQKIGAELDIARQIQSGSLPSVFPAFPTRTEFDLYASMRPAKQVGGDFYDFFLIDDDHLALVIADVSGKGVPAALFMMVTKILINEKAAKGVTPAVILKEVNDGICAHNQAEMFVTVWLGVLEISTGKVVAANAGHDNPVVISSGKAQFVKAKRGLVVGGMSGVDYADFTFQLKRGDKLFLYTDGVPEATDREQKMFGLGSMIDALDGCADAKPKEIIDRLYRAIDDFVGDAPQFDDTTMLCLSYFGDGSSEKDALTVPAKTQYLDQVNELVSDFLKKRSATPKQVNQMLLAVEEVFVNVCSYAYRGGDGDVQIRLFEENGRVFVRFTDGGVKYDPLKKPDPDLTLGVLEREEGGLGIYMAKKLVDKITYDFVDDKNQLTLEKKL